MPTKTQPSLAPALIPILKESLEHGACVAHLALALFDGLSPLHKLSKKWREILNLGAKLHDIGWIYGKKSHHKNSATMIRQGYIVTDIPLPQAVPSKIRPLVALVARYHRRADPSLAQKHFACLTPNEQHAIRFLAAIIRLADALDFSHTGSVKNVHVHLFEKHVQLEIVGTNPCLAEIYRVDVKKALFCEIFHLNILCTYTKEK